MVNSLSLKHPTPLENKVGNFLSNSELSETLLISERRTSFKLSLEIRSLPNKHGPVPPTITNLLTQLLGYSCNLISTEISP